MKLFTIKLLYTKRKHWMCLGKTQNKAAHVVDARDSNNSASPIIAKLGYVKLSMVKE